MTKREHGSGRRRGSTRRGLNWSHHCLVPYIRATRVFSLSFDQISSKSFPKQWAYYAKHFGQKNQRENSCGRQKKPNFKSNGFHQTNQHTIKPTVVKQQQTHLPESIAIGFADFLIELVVLFFIKPPHFVNQNDAMDFCTAVVPKATLNGCFPWPVCQTKFITNRTAE